MPLAYRNDVVMHSINAGLAAPKMKSRLARYERQEASRSCYKSPVFNDFHTVSRVLATVVSGAKLVR